MNVLLSIKPKFVEEIKQGRKKYELRKKIFKIQDEIENVYIYSTSPVKRIVGMFNIKRIIEDHPRSLWNKFHNFLGINKKEFFEYFREREKGFAIEITNALFFDKQIDPQKIFSEFVPPQSFCYLNRELPINQMLFYNSK